MANIPLQQLDLFDENISEHKHDAFLKYKHHVAHKTGCRVSDIRVAYNPAVNEYVVWVGEKFYGYLYNEE